MNLRQVIIIVIIIMITSGSMTSRSRSRSKRRGQYYEQNMYIVKAVPPDWITRSLQIFDVLLDNLLSRILQDWRWNLYEKRCYDLMFLLSVIAYVLPISGGLGRLGAFKAGECKAEDMSESGMVSRIWKEGNVCPSPRTKRVLVLAHMCVHS